jgi:hypothetical protein
MTVADERALIDKKIQLPVYAVAGDAFASFTRTLSASEAGNKVILPTRQLSVSKPAYRSRKAEDQERPRVH